jgi:hypothetical protein
MVVSFLGVRNTDATALMVVEGATLPATYVPYPVQLLSTASRFAAIELALKPAKGKVFSVFEDSISANFLDAGQNIITTRLGMVQGVNHSFGGNKMFQIFYNYWTSPNIFKDSNFLADFAGTQMFVVFLGTNDINSIAPYGSGIPLDAITDTPSPGANPYAAGSGRGLGGYDVSFYAYTMWSLDKMASLFPTIPIVVVTPYHRDRLATYPAPTGGFDFTTTDATTDVVIGALQTICASRGHRCVNLGTLSNFNKYNVENPDGTALMLRDGLHPSDTLGFPAISKPIAISMAEAITTIYCERSTKWLILRGLTSSLSEYREEF